MLEFIVSYWIYCCECWGSDGAWFGGSIVAALLGLMVLCAWGEDDMPTPSSLSSSSAKNGFNMVVLLGTVMASFLACHILFPILGIVVVIFGCWMAYCIVSCLVSLIKEIVPTFRWERKKKVKVQKVSDKKDKIESLLSQLEVLEKRMDND